MSDLLRQWADPRVWITLILIGLFGFAYINDPSDQAMKGALIAAFAAAYGFWIGASKTGGEIALKNADTIAKKDVQP